MKNISILIITAIGAVFSKLNFFSKMNKCKNMVKLIICAFAFVGLTACGGGGASTSTDGVALTDDTLIDRVNQDYLSNYILGNLDGTFLDGITQKIDDNTVDSITIIISNNDSDASTSVTVTINENNDWKTTTIDIFSLVDNEDGNKNFTISITYFDANSNEVSTETITTLNIIYDGTAPFIESLTDIATFLPITEKTSFNFSLTFSKNININTFTAEDFTIDIEPTGVVSISNIAFNGTNRATITVSTDIPADQTGNLTISVSENWTDIAGNKAIADKLLYTIDIERPSIENFTDINSLPITDKENFTFDIIFTKNINTNTFTEDDFTIAPSGLISITNIDFDGTTATITAIGNIPPVQTGNLTISVGNEWEDIVGNTPQNSEEQLYEIDIQLPTVTATDNETTATENEYRVTYTFSEEIEGITASDFTITTGTGTIASDITHNENKVILSVTSTEDIIEIRVTGFTDISKNVGLDNTAALDLGKITVLLANRIITDDEIEASGDTYTFTLTFTNEISADGFTIDDFTTNANGNITILNIITEKNALIRDATVEFEFINPNNTTNVDFTINTGNIGNTKFTNNEPIVISIDRNPLILSIEGYNKTEFNKGDLTETSNVISYTFVFSEAIDGLTPNDFVITPADSGVSPPSVTFNADATDATVTFTVAENTDATFSINLSNDSYIDQKGNKNNETIIEFPINITIDNIVPYINNPAAGNYDVATQSFTLNIEFSEILNLTDNNTPILTESNIALINATTTDPITIENSDGKARVVAVLVLDISKTQAAITISADSYSDTLGNTGESDYTLTIDTETLVSGWLTNGNCQNFAFDGGTGSTDTPYQISNICQLQNIADTTVLNDGTNLLTKNYILIADIDANYTRNWNNGQGFEPIGDIDFANNFRGIFDGNGYAIHHLYINRPDTDYIGLFGLTNVITTIAGTGGTKKVVVAHVTVIGNEYVGGIIGNARGYMHDSVVSGSVSGTRNVGGFAGIIQGLNTIKTKGNMSSTSVKGLESNIGIVSGFLLSNSYNDGIGIGSVHADTNVALFGSCTLCTLNNNLWLGSTNGNTDVGGVIGNLFSSITNNYWNTEISGQLKGIGNHTNDPNGIIEFSGTQAITDSEASLSGLGFGNDAAWENIDDFSYPVLKDNALDATEQTIFIAHGLFRLAVEDKDIITDQSVSNKVSNFLGGDNIQDDITLTASNFSANSPLTVIDTNLEASNDVSRVDYFTCVDGSNASDVANGSDGEVLTTTTVGKVALSVKKAGGNLGVKRTPTANGPAHGCQLELPAAPSAGDTLNLDVTFTKATAGETCETPDNDGYYRRDETDDTINVLQKTIYFCSYTRRFNITFK